MNAPISPRVIFFQVNNNEKKLQKIIESTHNHFGKKEPFIIFVEEVGLKFVDELLWRLPKTSFLPHSIQEKDSTDLVVITKFRKNLNKAQNAFNLCPTALLIETPFKIIYEFEDLSSPVKKNLSSTRFDAYKNAGFLIEAR